MENYNLEFERDSKKNAVKIALDMCSSQPSEALEQLRILAEEGSCMSQLALGDFYLYGRHGLEPDFILAEKFLQSAKGQGSREAAYRLAKHYLRSHRYDDAISELEELAESDFIPALFRLGHIYYEGVLAERNIKKSKEFFSRASDLGHIHSMHWLSLIKRRDPKLKSKIEGILIFLRSIPIYIRLKRHSPQSEKLRTS